MELKRKISKLIAHITYRVGRLGHGEVFVIAGPQSLDQISVENHCGTPLYLGFLAPHIWAPEPDYESPESLVLPYAGLLPELFMRTPDNEFSNGITINNLAEALLMLRDKEKIAVFLPNENQAAVRNIIWAVAEKDPERKYFVVKQVKFLGFTFLALSRI